MKMSKISKKIVGVTPTSARQFMFSQVVQRH